MGDESTTPDFPCSQGLYRYRLIPRGASYVEPRYLCNVEAKKRGKHTQREKKKALLLILCGRSTSGVFPT